MRLLIFLLAGLQIAGFAYIALSSDIGLEGTGLITLAGFVLAVCLAPALILAINRKALLLALGLTCIPLVLSVVGVGGSSVGG
jgi:hypothetical protein